MLLLFASCKKEKFFKGNTSLKISADTVWFDTVFTRAPGSTYPISVTQIFWIQNRENATIEVDLKLAGGNNSPYRINADGFSGPEIKGLEIPARDSIFVFVQCSLEPNNTTGPALVMDSILSKVNGKEQKTYLAAYGWDAHYYRSPQDTLISLCGEVWSDKTKPYVIINNAYVPQGCTFTIKEGVTVYNSSRSVLLVAGTLDIQGSAAEPVRFTGDKPTFSNRFLPNQWGGIYFAVGSVNNSIRFARINNAAVGIRVDSLPASGSNNLVLENTEILFAGQAALAGITANIKATNCVFGESGAYSFAGILGGNYEFIHCTFTGYSAFGSRQDGHFVLTNTLRDGNGFIIQTKAMQCRMVNSIVYGFLEEELFIDNKGSATFNTDIQNNILRSKSQPFSGNFYNQDPLFTSTSNYEFSLKSNSPAIDKALVLTPLVTKDFLNNPRDIKPDIGAFEKQP